MNEFKHSVYNVCKWIILWRLWEIAFLLMGNLTDFDIKKLLNNYWQR